MNKTLRPMTFRRGIAAGMVVATMSFGANTALATDGATGTTETTAAPSKKEQMAAYRQAMRTYQAAKAKISRDYSKAVKDANRARAVAIKEAKAAGKGAKKAIARAGKNHAAAMKQAKAARDAALVALGNPPTKP